MAEIPSKVEVGVTVMQRDRKLLTVYSQKWGAFTLPMTKRRRWAHPEDPCMIRPEDWRDTALRNFVECFGRTCTEEPELLLDITDFRQSDRDQVVKQYHFRVFRVAVAEDLPLVTGTLGQWLDAEEILDSHRRPVSSTARFLVQELKERGTI